MTGFCTALIALSSFGTINGDDSLFKEFLFQEKLARSLTWVPPPSEHRKPSHVIKLTLRTGINEDEKQNIIDGFDDGMDIEDIVDDIGIENVFKYNFRFRYKLRNGTKLYFGANIKTGSFSPYFGVFMKL